jgi:hypothetical protein
VQAAGRVEDEDELAGEHSGGGDVAPNIHWDRLDSLIAIGAGLATLAVHPVALILSRPYWLDEAWVAVLTRISWSSLVGASSSTPVGFVALLRLVPGSGLQRARLVVLAFSAFTVVMAYVVVRGCAWTSKPRARVTATVAALVTMLAPLSLGRNDLKQYTCDAFCALVVFAVAARIDMPSNRARTWWLAIASVALLPFSSTSAFVSIAAFAGLLGAALSTRSWRRVIAICVSGAATAAVFAAYFAVVILPNDNKSLRAYWEHLYLRGSLWQTLQEAWTRLTELQGWLGMPALAFVLFFITGVAVLWRLKARALAIGVPLLWVELAAVARFRRYPFLDLRTSTFLLVSSLVVSAIGAVELVRVARRWKPASAVIVGVGLATAFTVSFVPHVDEIHIPLESSRTPTVYVAEHQTANDVILVNGSGSFGFAYYWPHGRITTVPFDTAQGFVPRLRGVNAVYSTGRTDDAVLTAMRQAIHRWRGVGHRSRLFIVRSHLNRAETAAWEHAFATLRLHPQHIKEGPESVLVLGSH